MLARRAAFLLCLTLPVIEACSGAHSTQGKPYNPDRLRRHVEVLATDLNPRDADHPANLEAAATYIRRAFKEAGGRVQDQPFSVQGIPFRNVIARFGPAEGPRLVVGAHYDAKTGTPGADDNASGVAVLIELARALGREPPPGPVELAAYTLEEKWGKVRHMGSVVHARSLKSAGAQVRFMISLEMLGYFNDAPGTQRFPNALLKALYPTRGNFVLVAGRLSDPLWTRRSRRAFKRSSSLPVRSIIAPASLKGIDFSDHKSFWLEDIPAVMITDTAFYRNPHYHQAGDKPQTLDYGRMAEAARGIEGVVRALAAREANP